MLVITRKVHQTVRIGKDVVLKVVRISPTRVALAFDAPKEIAIKRGEINDDASDDSQ